jgi:hypothetical protein
MILQPNVRPQLQQRLDETRELEDVIPDQATDAHDESPSFQMSGLYEIIPGSDTSPLRIDSWTITPKA